MTQLMISRRDTLSARELSSTWKHDLTGDLDDFTDLEVENLRCFLYKQLLLSARSATCYEPPTPPEKKTIKMRSGVFQPLRPFYYCERQKSYSAPPTAKSRLGPSKQTIAKPSRDFGKRIQSAGSQYSALMRSISPKPIPHLYEEYKPLEKRGKP